MSENKYGKWKSEPLEVFFSKFPKPTLRMRIYRFGQKIKRKFSMSSRRTIHGCRGSVGVTHIPHQHQPTSAPVTFRESYHFDPERAYIERMQERAYMDMVDGKGDHDCDHEH